MNTIARKLVLSVLTVVLSVIALGTTTFAWFTITNTSAIQPFSANVTGDTGIEMALGVATPGSENLLNWVSVIQTEDIEEYIYETIAKGGLGFTTFTHVTTANGVDFFTLGVDSLTGTTAGYLSIPINFRSNSANAIQWSNVTLTSTTAPWTADVSFVGAKGTSFTSGDSLDINAADSFRIAIIGSIGGLQTVRGYENPDSITNVVLGGGTANPQDLSDGNVIVVDPLDPLQDIPAGDDGAMNYYYQKVGQLPFGADAVTVLETITSIASPITVVSLAATPTSGAANFGTIYIRIWLEGWDANAYNSVLNRAISASFKFVGTTV